MKTISQDENLSVTDIDDNSEVDYDDSCVEVITETLSAEPGIISVKLDTDQQQLAVAYDAQRISAPQVAQLAQAVGPALQQRMTTCTMRLGRRGGRMCESCAAILEGRVAQLPGVRQASASYTGGVLSVIYDHNYTSPAQLMQRISQLGANVAPSHADTPAVTAKPAVEENWLRRARRWLTPQRLEAIFTLITFVTMMLAWLLEYLGAPQTIVTSLYVIAYATGGSYGLKAGLESLRARTIDIDLLMILAALGAAAVGAPFEGAMLLFLFSLSNVLQAYALDRTRNAIRALMKLRPDQAEVRRGSRLVTLPVEEIVIGDRFVLRPGDRIPLDGTVVEGESTVDQAPITGESMPVAKRVGDTVLAGTINKNGSLEAQVTKLAKDSTIAKMIRLVEEAQSQKAQTQRFLDKAEQYYALGVIIFTILVAVVPIVVLGESFETAFYRAITVLVAASPCALIISTPASILSAIGNGARRGVLFKGGVYVEQAAGIKVVTFDKTGTLTVGKPQVTDVTVIANGPTTNGRWHGTADELLALAATLEAKSEHVLARATVAAANHRQLDLSEALAFQAATGKGVAGQVDGLDIRVGNLRYFEEYNCLGREATAQEVERLQAEGKTSVVVAQLLDDGQTAHLLGVIAFADKVRAEAADVIRDLKSLGVERVVMLTGDNERVAKAIAAQVGVDQYYADLLPEDKVRLAKELEAELGCVAMVGDGVNDAPALASASIGIAMGAAGTDVALETADIVLLSDDLTKIPYAIALSRQTRKTLIVNLGFALTMIVVMLIGIFAVALPLPLAVLGHEGGTVLVSLNGLRLLVYDRKK